MCSRPCCPALSAFAYLRSWGCSGRAGPIPQRQLAAVAAFSLVSGAPNGAKLLCALAQDKIISRKDAERLLPLLNNVSPLFLLSIIASELLKDKALFRPMAAAFYGCILFFLLPLVLQNRRSTLLQRAPEAKAVPFSEALTSAVRGSMSDMLNIGGCILFACTLLYVTRTLLPQKAAQAVLAGAMEVSIGTASIASLDLPLRLRVSLSIGAASFGGLSLALQTACCYPGLSLARYLLEKLALGAAVGFVCFLIFPLFPGVFAVFAGRQAVPHRSLSLSALLLSSLLSAAFIAVVSLMASSRKA